MYFCYNKYWTKYLQTVLKGSTFKAQQGQKKQAFGPCNTNFNMLKFSKNSEKISAHLNV